MTSLTSYSHWSRHAWNWCLIRLCSGWHLLQLRVHIITVFCLFLSCQSEGSGLSWSRVLTRQSKGTFSSLRLINPYVYHRFNTHVWGALINSRSTYRWGPEYQWSGRIIISSTIKVTSFLLCSDTYYYLIIKYSIGTERKSEALFK